MIWAWLGQVRGDRGDWSARCRAWRGSAGGCERGGAVIGARIARLPAWWHRSISTRPVDCRHGEGRLDRAREPRRDALLDLEQRQSDREISVRGNIGLVLVAGHGIIDRMSRHGVMWDATAILSCYSSPAWVCARRQVHTKRDKAKRGVCDCGERSDNQPRGRHPTLEYRGPAEIKILPTQLRTEAAHVKEDLRGAHRHWSASWAITPRPKQAFA